MEGEAPPVAAVYADGGVIRINPSPFGGTYAACHVATDGTHLWEASGVVLPVEVGGPVTNNQTEFYAALIGLEALMETDRKIALCSDSHVTLIRFTASAPCRNIPEDWVRRMDEVILRNKILAIQLDGHPTQKHLASGFGSRGNRVSRHNVWCDLACAVAGRDYMTNLHRGAE